MFILSWHHLPVIATRWNNICHTIFYYNHQYINKTHMCTKSVPQKESHIECSYWLLLFWPLTYLSSSTHTIFTSPWDSHVIFAPETVTWYLTFLCHVMLLRFTNHVTLVSIAVVMSHRTTLYLNHSSTMAIFQLPFANATDMPHDHVICIFLLFFTETPWRAALSMTGYIDNR